VLLRHIPLQEVKGGVVLGGHGCVRQFVDFSGDQLLVLISLLQHFVQGVEGDRRGFNGAQYRHRARIAQVVEQTLHVLHLFCGVLTHKRSRTLEAFVVAPCAHLQVQVGRIEFQIQLIVQLSGHFISQHGDSFNIIFCDLLLSIIHVTGTE